MVRRMEALLERTEERELLLEKLQVEGAQRDAEEGRERGERDRMREAWSKERDEMLERLRKSELEEETARCGSRAWSCG